MLYFDNAATTKISDISLEAYNKASEVFFNPSALYSKSIDSKNIIEESRKYILKYFNASANSTIIFTGSASESNNAVLNSCVNRKDKKYLISAGEHSSIYVTAKHLQEQGYNIVFVPLKSNGGVDENKLFNELDETVAFVSLIYVSNETGAINDIKNITKRIKSFNPNILVHSDGVQAVGKFKIDLHDLGVDYFTMSAHKINGPKGIGALYIASPNKFRPFILGGGQEMNLRAGTENIPAILAFKTAIENLIYHDFSEHKKQFIDNLTGDYILVSDNKCVDNIISLCFKGVRGETIAHMLEVDYLIGTGSACNSKAKINRVLSPIVSPKYIDGAIRISFGFDITPQNCKDLANAISNAVKTYIERIKR